MEIRGRVRPYLGIGCKFLLVVGLMIGASQLSDLVMGRLSTYLTPSTEPALHLTIMTAIAVYVLLMALPFVPGVEIGLGLIAAFGPKIAPLVYGATVLSLTLAFAIGRLVPQGAIIDTFETLGLKRGARLLGQLQPLEPGKRLQFLLASTDTRFVPFLLRHRFLALMMAINMPGNALIGGGGGICLVAGFSRLYALPWFVLAMALAVLPVPLIVLISGEL